MFNKIDEACLITCNLSFIIVFIGVDLGNGLGMVR